MKPATAPADLDALPALYAASGSYPARIRSASYDGAEIVARLLDTAGDFATYYFPAGCDGTRKRSRGYHQVFKRGDLLPDLYSTDRNLALSMMRQAAAR